MATPKSKQKPLAVVTGASQGIGYELAKVFAENGFDLLITAQSDLILKAESELRNLGTEIESVMADLSTYEGVEKLYAKIKGWNRPVSALAVNAGVGVGGPFLETSLKEELDMIHLNVVGVVHLTKRVAKDMAEKGSGKILITSSIAAVMPAPFEAVYGATKAFDLVFAEGIREELKDKGITVTALMPGATNTNFFERAGLEDTKVGAKEKYENDPYDVARQGFEALMAGKDHIVAASFKAKLQGIMAKFLPETVKAKWHRNISEPGSAPEKKSA